MQPIPTRPLRQRQGTRAPAKRQERLHEMSNMHERAKAKMNGVDTV